MTECALCAQSVKGISLGLVHRPFVTRDRWSPPPRPHHPISAGLTVIRNIPPDPVRKQPAGGDTGFSERGGGGPGNCTETQHIRVHVCHVLPIFMKFRGPQKGGGRVLTPKTPPPLDPPLPCIRNPGSRPVD